MHDEKTHDIIIVGGSFAGLAAGLQLARARKRVAVLDAGIRRNRFAHASHGFLGQDGRPPADIVADARAQLMVYPTVEFVETTATRARKAESAFAISADDGREFFGRRLILATGVVDELPDVEGLRERWGTSVFHCPYCHGYELGMGRLGVVATGPMSLHHALLISEWGSTTLLTNGLFEPDDEHSSALAARGISVEKAGIARVENAADIILDDGRRLEFDGLFTTSRTRMASPLAEQLGCAFTEGPLGAFIETSGGFMETSVAGVFACGDAARAAGSVSVAVGDGCLAGVGAHRSLLFG